MSIHHSYVEANVGESVIIKCLGYKALWIFDKPTIFHHINVSKDRTFITLTNLKTHDSGMYTCVVGRIKSKIHPFFARAVVKVFGKIMLGVNLHASGCTQLKTFYLNYRLDYLINKTNLRYYNWYCRLRCAQIL